MTHDVLACGPISVSVDRDPFSVLKITTCVHGRSVIQPLWQVPRIALRGASRLLPCRACGLPVDKGRNGLRRIHPGRCEASKVRDGTLTR